MMAGEKVQMDLDGNVTSPQGFSAGGMHCGIRKRKLDLGWLISDVPATAAGVYTTNQFQAPPIQVTKESILVDNKIQGVLVNSGVANACTGEQGMHDAIEMRRIFAEQINVSDDHIAIASTGLIGVPLPVDRIKNGLTRFAEPEHQQTDRFEKAILTTDTCEKSAAVQIEIDGKTVTIGGAAKGSGMIEPNMATMLAFITTDAEIAPASLSVALKQAVNKTFNMITVDGDSSTNDMVLVMANGKAENDMLTENHPDWGRFLHGLGALCEQLAKMIARDGEGATKLIEVIVSGAESDEAAKKVSKTVISSNLVKTAVYGSDPNWGRIVCAIGYSGQPVNPERVSVTLGEINVVENGLPLPFSEQDGIDYLNQDTISIKIDLRQGDGSATAWGCDLTYDYVKINASYRT